MSNYLDKDGLTRLWSKIKAYVNEAVMVLNDLGDVATENIVPIEKGGTDGTTSEEALTNLGAFPKSGGTIDGDVAITGDLTIRDNVISDYITRHTDGSIWHCEYYASGRYRAWTLVKNLKPSSMTATGSNYYGTVNLGSIPSFSTSVESIMTSFETSQYAWASRISISSAGTISLSILRSLSSAPTISVWVEIQGRYD